MSLNPKYDAKHVAGSSNIVLKPVQCVLRGVYVTITNAGDKIYFCDNDTTNSNTQFYVEATNAIQMQYVNKTFLNGLTLAFSGTTAQYVVIFE